MEDPWDCGAAVTTDIDKPHPFDIEDEFICFNAARGTGRLQSVLLTSLNLVQFASARRAGIRQPSPTGWVSGPRDIEALMGRNNSALVSLATDGGRFILCRPYRALWKEGILSPGLRPKGLRPGLANLTPSGSWPCRS